MYPYQLKFEFGSVSITLKDGIAELAHNYAGRTFYDTWSLKELQDLVTLCLKDHNKIQDAIKKHIKRYNELRTSDKTRLKALYKIKNIIDNLGDENELD